MRSGAEKVSVRPKRKGGDHGDTKEGKAEKKQKHQEQNQKAMATDLHCEGGLKRTGSRTE